MNGWLMNERGELGDGNNSYSAERLKDEATKIGFSLRIYKPSQINFIVIDTGSPLMYIDGVLSQLPDFVIIRIAFEKDYYAISVIRYLESLGVIVINSYSSMKDSGDKLYSLQLLSQFGISVPKTILGKPSIDISYIKKELGFPLIIKTLYGSQGTGVFLASNESEVMEIVHNLEKNTEYIFQEFIEYSRGKDLRVFVLGGKVIGCMLRKAKEGNFKANFSQGGTVEVFPLSPEIEKLAIDSCRILGVEIAGVDLLFDNNSFCVCEVNYSPGFTGMEVSNNTNIAGVILEYIKGRVLEK